MFNVVSITDPITEVLNNFLKPFDCEAFFSTDFAFFSGSNRIAYSIIVTDKGSKEFEAFVKKLFPEITANVFLWSFLHEIGHRETEDDFTDEEWDEYMEITRKKEISNQEYFNLPIERAATEWAGNYMITHEEEITNLWIALKAAIKHTYKVIEKI